MNSFSASSGTSSGSTASSSSLPSIVSSSSAARSVQCMNVQLGPTSNYVCSYLWNQRYDRINAQDTQLDDEDHHSGDHSDYVNYSYCFRESESKKKSPRTIVIDFKDNLYVPLDTVNVPRRGLSQGLGQEIVRQGWSQQNAIADLSTVWGGSVHHIQQEPMPSSSSKDKSWIENMQVVRCAF
jgi:hypothetical protein